MLSFLTMISYDFRYALKSIARYYDIADEIVLGLDKDRISFSGHQFFFDQGEFFSSIESIDKSKKIRIYEEDFHSFGPPMINDQNERLFLASKCRKDHWIIQIDADEFILNPGEFKSWIQKVPKGFGINARWVTIFKQFDEDFLIIEEPNPMISIGTKDPSRYVASRITNEPYLDSPMVILHQAWGRTREDLAQKLKNWAHSPDFDTTKYLSFWDKVDLDNYKSFRDFHPLVPQYWPSLEKVRLRSFLSS